MTTTLQQIQDRAVASSVANGISSLVSDRAEIINKIASFELDVFDLAAEKNRYYYAVRVAVASSGGSSERTIDLATLTIPCTRLLKFKLNDGRDVNQVDLQDTDAELAPRYYVLGKVLYEIASDWSPNSGVVSAKLTYMRGPAALDVAGTLTQTVTLEDNFSDLLELRLARYLAQKDVGREESELKRLDADIAAADQSFVDHITQFGGVEARRFNTPAKGDKQ